MSTIYLILGIMGWSAAAVVVPLYIIRGRRDAARGFDADAVGSSASAGPGNGVASGNVDVNEDAHVQTR